MFSIKIFTFGVVFEENEFEEILLNKCRVLSQRVRIPDLLV